MFDIFTKTDPRHLKVLCSPDRRDSLWLRSLFFYFRPNFSEPYFPAPPPTPPPASIFPSHKLIDIAALGSTEVTRIQEAAASITKISDLFDLTFRLCNGYLNFYQTKTPLVFRTKDDLDDFFSHLPPPGATPLTCMKRMDKKPGIKDEDLSLTLSEEPDDKEFINDLKFFLLLSFLHTHSMTIKQAKDNASAKKNPLIYFTIPLKYLDVTGLEDTQAFSGNLDENGDIISPFLRIFTRYPGKGGNSGKAPSFKHFFLSPLTVDFIANVVSSKGVASSPFYQYFHAHYENNSRRMGISPHQFPKKDSLKLTPWSIPSRFRDLSLKAPRSYIEKVIEDLFPTDQDWLLATLPYLNQYLLERLFCLNLINTIYMSHDRDSEPLSPIVNKFSLSPLLKYRQRRFAQWQAFLHDLPRLADNNATYQSYLKSSFEAYLSNEITYHVTILLPFLEIVFTLVASTALHHGGVKIADFVDALCKSPSSASNFIVDSNSLISPRIPCNPKSQSSQQSYRNLYEDVFGELFQNFINLTLLSNKTNPHFLLCTPNMATSFWYNILPSAPPIYPRAY